MFIDHVIARSTSWRGPQRAPTPGKLYEVVYAANGVFIRAQREGLAAQIPLSLYLRNLPGLMSANLVVNLTERVNHNILSYLVESSRMCLPNEALFYLKYKTNWQVIIPPQFAVMNRVKPEGQMSGYENVILEVHSHNTMGAFFSEEDDRDETGFRIYAVLGRLDRSRPEILVRVGIYGHRAIVPANLVFQNPEFLGVKDAHDGLH